MKTSKIITTIASLNLVLFMSVSSIAKPVTNYEGDIIKSGVKKQIEAVKGTITEIASNVSSGNEFSNLRFDVNKFNAETEVVELPLNSIEYLRFDARDFNTSSDLSEMPVNEFDYLHFDVNSYTIASEISDMPVNSFDYLRFDVKKYSVGTSVAIDELPVN
ncbi:MAG: hypothetical protein Q7U54_11075 [Bacteroidales bacterium]|nr:hypothetical protein [Bacteroidales bacterium]